MATGPTPAPGRRLLLPLGCLLLLAGLAWTQRPDGRLHVYVLQTTGDAILIQTPAGRFVLIDGGSDPARLNLLLGRLMPYWRRDLRAVLLTGVGSRRLSGQVAALARYRPDVALAPPGLGQSGHAGEWRRLTATWPTRTLAPGQRLTLDGATLTVLAAEAGDQGGAVLLLSYGATRVLFHSGGSSGDEAALRAAGRPLDLLVYPWQRSLATTTITALRPRAIAFTDAYEAPAPALLSFADRRRYSPQVFHSKADGQIELVSDGRRSIIMTSEE
jgi:hypothetical protein